MRFEESDESGFTLIEVAIASFITMSSLVFLAGLFTLAIAQNRLVKQYTTAVALAQWKLEELNAIEASDKRLFVGGSLTAQDRDYSDTVYVDPKTGLVTTDIPPGVTPIYDRFWKIEDDASLDGVNARIISVKVRARQPSIGRTAEEATLATERSW